MRFLILLLIVFIFSCKNEPIDKEYEAFKQTSEYKRDQRIIAAMEANEKRLIFVGYETMPNLSDEADPDNNEEWFKESRLLLKNDSAYMDKWTVIVKNNDTFSAEGDGSYEYLKGTFDSLASNVRINLVEITRGKMGGPYKKMNGKWKRIYDTLNLKGKMGKNSMILNGVNYKLKIDSDIFMSMFYERDTTRDILDSL